MTHLLAETSQEAPMRVLVEEAKAIQKEVCCIDVSRIIEGWVPTASVICLR